MPPDKGDSIPYLPLFFNLVGAPCLVVGGGRVACRKVQDLLAAEAEVTVVSPQLVKDLRILAAQGKFHWRAREYHDGEARDYRLVIGTTNDPAVNELVSRDCGACGIPVNIVDQPALCSVIFPAVIPFAAATIAVASGGKAPYFTRFLKDHVAASLKEVHQLQYPDLIVLFRQFAKSQAQDKEQEDRLYRRFLSADAQQWARWARLKSPQTAWRRWLKTKDNTETS